MHFSLCTAAGQLRVHDTTKRLRLGSVIIIPRGTYSQVQAPAWRLRVRNRALSQNLIVDRQAGMVLRRACQWASESNFCLPIASRQRQDLARKIKSCCQAINMFHRKSAFFELIAQLDVITPGDQEEQQKQGAALFMRHLIEYIAKHYAEPLQVADAQAMTGLSRSHFHAAFRQATGTTFLRYVTALRVGEACRLLRHTQQSILDVALSCGFGSPSHFFKAFKRHTGTTPERYRTGK